MHGHCHHIIAVASSTLIVIINVIETYPGMSSAPNAPAQEEEEEAEEAEEG